MAKTKRTIVPAGAASGSRRRFLSSAAVMGGAAALAALPGCESEPPSSNAVSAPGAAAGPSVTLRMQAANPSGDFFFALVQDYARIVSDRSGGGLKIDVLAAGAVVKAFDMADAVHKG
ncbi:MAG TPA: hypothetical protein VES94_01710, partial [Burkholderiales bacterium]|nr:hypothetical protein [Burkholderiales bacterium]